MKNYFLALVLFCSCSMGFSQSFEGNWKGSLQVSGMELPLIFEFKYNGAWEGTMQSPKQSSNRFPLTSILAEGDSIFVELKSMGVKYAGKISTDRKSIDGKFQQGGLKTELVLNKLTAEQASEAGTFKRSQRVNPPYSYDTVDVTFENKIDKVTLAGTITKPKELGKYPAVILVSGSGPQDRNETLMGHEPFKVLADYLTKNNIVVLRYDDRGVGKSQGDFAKSTTGDFGKDALAALSFLRKQAQVDPMKVGIIGHSEGGLIATILAGQQASGLNFIVTLAGPTIRMDSLMILQNAAIMKSQGKDISAIERAIIKKNYEIMASDLPSDKAFDAIRNNMRSVSGSQNMESADQLAALVTPWFRHFIKIDPVPFIKKIKIPTFAAFGGKDVQVPAGENIESLTDNLPKNKKDLSKVYPNLNHLFQNAKTGAVGEYAEIEETMNPEVLKDITAWIKAL